MATPLGCLRRGRRRPFDRRERSYPSNVPPRERPAAAWKFVTNHCLVLLCICEDPGIRMVDVAERVGITERGVQGIVGDLVRDGYLYRERVGRRNHYRINSDLPLRHIETQHSRLADLLALLATHEATREGSPADRRPDTSAEHVHS